MTRTRSNTGQWRSRFAATIVWAALVLALFPGIAHAFKLESDTVVLNDTLSNPSFTSVTFRQTYDTPPVVLPLATRSGGQPAALRIRNVTTTGFEIAQTEATSLDGGHVSMTIDYVAVEPGVHTFPDGTVLEAGTISTTATQAGFGPPFGGWETVGLAGGFPSTPAVVAHLQSMANETGNPPGDSSVPFLSTALRNVGAAGFEAAIERSESPDGAVTDDETIGYLAIAGGVTGTFDDNAGSPVDYEGLVTPNNIEGWDDGCFGNGFSGAYGSPPQVVATMNTRSNDDGGWLRRCSLSASAIGLRVDEDVESDGERSHPPETAGAVVFSRDFDAEFAGAPETLLEYRMEADSWDGTTGEVADATGNGRSGTAEGGATTAGANPATGGNPGTCRYGEFDGDGDYVVDSDAGNYLNGLTGITVTAWVRNTADTPTDGGIFTTGTPQGQDNRLGLRYDAQGASTGNSANLKASVNTDQCAAGQDCIQVETESGLQVQDQWQHVAMTWQSGDKIRIYIDGDEVQTTVVVGSGNLTGILDDVDFLRLGRSTNGSNDWQGQMDEFRVYDQALGDGKIKEIRDETHPCPALCAADFSVHSAGSLSVANNVQVNGTRVSGTGNSIDPDTAMREDATRSLPDLEPESFPTNFNGSDETLEDGDIINAGDYDQVDFERKNAEVTFDTSNGNDFRIDELQSEEKSTLNLQPGRYFIGSVTLGKQSVINVNGEVELFVNDQFQTGEKVEINAAGNPGDLTVNLYDGAEFSLGKNSEFTATVYGPGSGTELTVEQGASVTGGLFSGGDITLEKNVDQTFNQSAEGAGRAAAGCVADGIDHYAIDHSGNLVSCDAETVTITAHDASDNPVDAGDATIDLSTSTGEGTWARVLTGSGTLTDATAGDGVGSYSFSDNGETDVELAFNYTSVNAGSQETVNFDVIDGAGNSESASEDPDLIVRHSGFRITDGSGDPIDIPGQIAAKPSNTAPGAQPLALQAIRTSDDDPTQCEPAFPDGTTVEVELGAECKDPSSCAGRALEVSNDGNTTAIDTAGDDGSPTAPSYTPVDLTFGPNAEAPLELVYPDAGAIQLHARANPIDDGTSSPPVVEYITGSSNVFAVRPFGFYLDFDPDGDTVFDDRAGNGACAGQISCAGDANGDVFTTAGEEFPVRVEAVVWQAGDDDDDDNGVPDSNQALADNDLTPNFGQEAAAETVDLNRTLVAPAGDPGSLGGGQNIGDPNDQAFSNGSIVANGVSWDEVGIIELAATLSDGTYLTSDNVTGRAPNVGRFIPARLDATGNTPDFEPFCDGFTYLDQSFGYLTDPAITVSAYNADGGVTRNYGAGFWKLPVPATRDYTDTSGSAATVTVDSGTIAWNDGGNDGLGGGGSDTAPITDERLTYGRNGLEAPFDAAVDLRIPKADLTDSDGVCAPDAVPADGICNTNAGDTGADLVFDGDGGAGQQPIGGTQLRFGRLRLDDAYGPEVAPVVQRWQLDYWTGTTWAINGDDTCTVLALADDIELDPDDTAASGNEVDGTQEVDLSSGDGTTEIEAALDVMSGSILFTGGVAEVRYEAPGAGNRGWIETRALLADD